LYSLLYTLCTVELPCECTEENLALVKQRWQEIYGSLTAEQQIELYHNILNDIAISDYEVAIDLWSLLIEASEGYCSMATSLFFQGLNELITLYPDEAKLRAFIQHNAEINPDVARVFAGNAPIIARSLVR